MAQVNYPEKNFVIQQCTDEAEAKVAQSLIDKLYVTYSKALPFAAPDCTLRKTESQLISGVLQMLQGFSSSLFHWDDCEQSFYVKNGIYVNHLSQTSLNGILSRFIYAATCLQLVELFVKQMEISHARFSPTLKGFANSVSAWLMRLRAIALKVELRSAGSETGITITLMGLVDTLSSVCSGAELLLQIVHGAIPHVYFDLESSISAGEMAVHILDYLYKKLNEVCLVQGGEEEAYHMLLVLFIGSLLPYIEGLGSWLYEGTLNDPFEELFFYANNAIAIDEAAFWETSYLLRLSSYRNLCPWISSINIDGKSMTNNKREKADGEANLSSGSVRGKDTDFDNVVCPLFLKDIARSIVSAGKSLQLIRHVPGEFIALSDGGDDNKNHGFGGGDNTNHGFSMDLVYRLPDFKFDSRAQNMGRLTLPEIFCISLVGLIGDGCQIHQYIGQEHQWTLEISQSCKFHADKKMLLGRSHEAMPCSHCSEKIWRKSLDTISQKTERIDVVRDPVRSVCKTKDLNFLPVMEISYEVANYCSQRSYMEMGGQSLTQSYWAENPAITVCRKFLEMNKASWEALNLSRSFCLPPLNDGHLQEATFGGDNSNAINKKDELIRLLKRANYTSVFGFGRSEYGHAEDDIKTLESLCPFPTLLPCFQEDLAISQLLPFQKNSTLESRVLNWIQMVEPKRSPLPVVIILESLVAYIKKQVDYVGKHIMFKLMNSWRLMDEINILRAIYLLGSGDLLQRFLTLLFDKLDKGESWDDYFELNTMLQESIRNSADGMLLIAPDSLVVSVKKHPSLDDDEHKASLVSNPLLRNHHLGIDALDLLQFTYKVSWPLVLIANQDAIKKYNQVMSFLLKVKRAKFVLDKARRWMWKDRGNTRISHKHHMLVEQKLLHFVDAFHQYVMDRVYHSSWLELCEGMASAGSLDEVIGAHESYLLSIQRQCFVAPDKLWALIASRIKSILGLALDFYSIQQTLCSGGEAPAIKARCEMEVDRIEKQFDDCIAFLLRVLSFKLNVGHFPHLADLVTRINYNYFYMSDNGNLLTVPGSETAASKLGQPYWKILSSRRS